MLALKSTSAPARLGTNSRSRSMAHKFDTGFAHYNLQQTTREALASRAPRGLLGTDLLKSAPLVRCLPTDDSSGNSSSTPDEELLLAYSGQGSGVTGATQPPQEEMGPGSRGAKGQGSRDGELLNAHWYPTMPQGDEAHNAAHCEPIPGDWPDPAPVMKPADAVSPDENLDAIHAAGAAHAPGSGPVGGTSAGAARDDSSFAAHGVGAGEQGGGGGQQQQGADFHAASRPGDDPQGIKDVVRQETLGEEPQDKAA